MYGYIIPDKKNLKPEDFYVYKAFYCGMCKATGKLLGQPPRLAVNYDITFFTVLLHDILTEDVVLEKCGCIFSPANKNMQVVSCSALMSEIAYFNTLFAYHKLLDDVRDSGGFKKRMQVRALSSAYQKARQALPELDTMIYEHLDRLCDLEKQNCDNIDMVSDVFAGLMRDSADFFLKRKGIINQDALDFFYHLGKWVYLMDALDDIHEDFKSHNYNPFISAFGNYKDRLQFFEKNRQQIEFISNITINKMIGHFNAFKLTQSYDLLQNIVHNSFRQKVNEILNSNKKLKKVRI